VSRAKFIQYLVKVYFTIYEYFLMETDKNIFSPADRPLKLGVLVLPDSNMLSLAASIDPLRAANRQAENALFEWQILSVDEKPVVLTSGIEIQGTPIDYAPDYDALLIVAGFRLVELATPKLLRRLRHLAPQMDGMGGIDGGSWFLARAGLLDGRRATTHFEDLEEFEDAFPQVNVVRDRFTLSGKYFTTGGAAPCIDMMLRLIRARHGPQLAMRVSGALLYDTVHDGTAPQRSIPLERLRKSTPKVAAAIEIMELGIENPTDIAAIAEKIGVTARHLETLFRRELETTPGKFFRNLRLAEARRLLLDTGLSVQNIAVRCGFGSQAAFARAFREKYHQSASQARTAARS
jgi:transcriptional regulator GlxA family with amidase domain